MRHSRLPIAAAWLIAASIASASAQSDQEMRACIDQSGGVTSKMLDCGKVEIDKWDQRLNAAYQTLLHRATPTQQAGLRREQRDWLQHHRTETRRLADAPDNGSAAFLTSQSFELDDIAKRTTQLERRSQHR